MTRYWKLYAAVVGSAGTVVTGVGSHGSWTQVLPATLTVVLVWWLKNEEAK